MKGSKTEKMKVCLLTPYPPYPKGMTHSKYLFEQLNKIVDTEVYPWNHDGFFKRTISPFVEIFRLRKALRKYDIIHLQYALANYMVFFFPVLWILKIGAKARVIMTTHEDFKNLPLSSVVIFFHNIFYHAVDKIITHTEEHKKELSKSLQKKTVVIEHGIIRRDVHRKEKKNTVLIAGFINRWKGHDVAVKAISKVKEKIHDVKLLIVGKPHDKKFVEEVDKLIEELRLQDNVERYYDYVPEDKFFEFYQQSTICILPYTRITMSGILCHVMSWHLPAVMSDVPAFREFSQGEGLFVRIGDPDDLADKIIYALTRKEWRKRISRKYAEFAERFSWKNIAKRSVEEYKKLLVR